MTLEQFITKNLGQKLDYDGVYGAQCVDLFRCYSRDVLGIKEHTGAVEGAKDLFLRYSELIKEQKYFEKLGKTRHPLYGDICIWDGTQQNKYGHVAIFLGECKDGIFVLEQNGITQNGVELNVRSRLNLLGFLRKK